MRGIHWSRTVSVFAALCLFGSAGVRGEQESTAPSSANPSALEASAASPSILQNGGCEAGNLTPEAWQKGNDVQGVEYLWTSGVSHTGRSSLCLKKTAKGYWPIAEWYQEIPREGSATTLAVSAWVKAQDAGKAVIDVQFQGDAAPLGHKWIVFIGPKTNGDPLVTHDWKQYAGEVAIPVGTRRIRVGLQMYGPGVVAFDDVVARYVGDAGSTGSGAAVSPAGAASASESTSSPASSAAAGMAEAAPSASAHPIALANVGFEEGTGGPDGWSQGGQVPGVEYLWDRNTAHSGKASLCLRKSVRKYFPIAQWTQTVEKDRPARSVRLTGWVKCDAVTKAILDVQFVDAQGEWTHAWAVYIGAKEANDPPVTHDWKQYTGEVPIPMNTSQVRVALQIYGPGTVWLDDMAAYWVE